MKKKKISYRIIRIKRIFSGDYWCITWTKSLTNLHMWVNWSRLYPTVTSARSCNNVGHLFWFTILAPVLISSCNFDVEKYSLCLYVRYEYTEWRHWSRAARELNKVSSFCYSWPTHIDGMYVCVLGIPKGKFSKQIKKKKLSYRIIRIKHK
jgi:hypothetical protein